MAEQVTAVYNIDGVIQLPNPLDLPNNIPVRVLIEPLLPEESPLIDDIPISEDPELYAKAAELGPYAQGLHAWQILPMRYKQGEDSCSQKINLDELDDPLAHIHEFAVDMGIEDLAENLVCCYG